MPTTAPEANVRQAGSETPGVLPGLLRGTWRLLTFRSPGSAIRRHAGAFLAFGLFWTWLAGVGRYWDNPRAALWQHLGLGSVAYVFVLALLVWGLLAPLRPQHWSYRNVLTFITLTAPPAILYAIPVERFLAPADARAANVWFLGVVATWRVALYAVFLTRTARLGAFAATVGTLMPLVLIVFTLSALNLEHVVFDIMRGTRPEDRTGNDDAYEVVVLLSILSTFVAPFLLAIYLGLCFQAARRSPVRAERRNRMSVVWRVR